MNRSELARWLRIPPHKIAHMRDATFSNIESQTREYVTDTLQPWMVRWEQEIQRKLTAKNGYVEKLATNNKPHDENVRKLFLRTLARPPRPEEMTTAVEFLNTETDRHEAYRSLIWSLLATNEFLLNH